MARGRVSNKALGQGHDIDRYKRRVWEISDNPELRELQRQISRETARLSVEEMLARSDTVVSLEIAIENAATPEARARLEMALNRYRENHIDQAVSLVDVSGQVRTIAEAKQVLDKLGGHTTAARDARLKENYMTAISGNGYGRLKAYLSTLSDEEFKLAFYANPNAEIGFEYHTDENREEQLLEQWKRAVNDVTERKTAPEEPVIVPPAQPQPQYAPEPATTGEFKGKGKAPKQVKLTKKHGKRRKR